MLGQDRVIHDLILLSAGGLIGGAMGTVLASLLTRWLSGTYLAAAGMLSALVNLAVGQIFFSRVDLARELGDAQAQGVVRIGYWIGLGLSLLVLNYHVYRTAQAHRSILRPFLGDDEIDVLILSLIYKLNRTAIAKLLDIDKTADISRILEEGLRRLDQRNDDIRRELFKRVRCRVPLWKIKRALRRKRGAAPHRS